MPQLPFHSLVKAGVIGAQMLVVAAHLVPNVHVQILVSWDIKVRQLLIQRKAAALANHVVFLKPRWLA